MAYNKMLVKIHEHGLKNNESITSRNYNKFVVHRIKLYFETLQKIKAHQILANIF